MENKDLKGAVYVEDKVKDLFELKNFITNMETLGVNKFEVSSKGIEFFSVRSERDLLMTEKINLLNRLEEVNKKLNPEIYVRS